jgi:hypothetical protein
VGGPASSESQVTKARYPTAEQSTLNPRATLTVLPSGHPCMDEHLSWNVPSIYKSSSMARGLFPYFLLPLVLTGQPASKCLSIKSSFVDPPVGWRKGDN